MAEGDGVWVGVKVLVAVGRGVGVRVGLGVKVGVKVGRRVGVAVGREVETRVGGGPRGRGRLEKERPPDRKLSPLTGIWPKPSCKLTAARIKTATNQYRVRILNVVLKKCHPFGEIKL
jgi:hypothetical protein